MKGSRVVTVVSNVRTLNLAVDMLKKCRMSETLICFCREVSAALCFVVYTTLAMSTMVYSLYCIPKSSPSCRNTKSESCPFCRGSIKRVKSRDLWVLTCSDDVVDPETVSREDLLHFYLYINSLPKDSSEAVFLMHYEYLL